MHFGLGPQPGDLLWPTVSQLARGPAQLPGCTNRGRDFARIFQWGIGTTNVASSDNVPEAIRAIDVLTRAYLASYGVTLKEAEQWTYAYAFEATQYPNPSAYARALLFWCAVKLLRSTDEAAAGPDCCAEELEYHSYPPPPRPPRGWRERG